MSVTVVAQAGTWLLTTVDRVKTELSITDTADDEVMLRMIDRASSAIARECRRVFGVETVTETLDGTGSRLLALTRTPVIAITEVTEDGSMLAASEYRVEDAEAGALYRMSGWGRPGGLRMWGTEAYASGYILPGYQNQRYSVTYRAGYILPPEQNPYLMNGSDDPQNLPGAVEQAAIEAVKSWYRARVIDRDNPGVLKRIAAGSVSLEWDVSARTLSAEGLPSSALGLLRNYYAGWSR